MLGLDPLKAIPMGDRPQFLDKLTEITRIRVAVMGVSLFSMFLIAGFLVRFLNPGGFEWDDFSSSGGISLGAVVLILFLNTRVRKMWQAKINAFLLTAFVLFFLVFGSEDTSNSFNIPIFLLLFFFSALIIPWFFWEVLCIAVLFSVGWALFCIHQDFKIFSVPLTLFGTNPLVNGFISLGFAAVMCLLIRQKETERDVENFLLLKDVERKNEKMLRELELASRIHRTLLPASMSTPQADILVTYLPVSKVGGDYAKFEFVGDDKLVFFISDITGHGIPAALMVNRLHAEFSVLVKESSDPGILLGKLNDFIIRDFVGTGMFLSAVCGLVDFKQSKIFYSNYGHPPQYVYRMKDSDIFSLNPQTTLLGVRAASGEQMEVYEGEIPYKKGDLVLLFTDGVLETKNKSGEQYGEERLKEFLRQHAQLPFGELNKQLVDELNAFNDGAFNDDVFIMSIKPHW